MQENTTSQNDVFVYQKIKNRLLYFLAFQIVLIVYLIIYFPNNNFEIRFFDVGQGDSIFIKTPENHQILIDTGPDNKVLEQLLNAMPFFDRSIDLLILTHNDLDHIGGALDILKRYEVDYIFLNGVSAGSPIYLKLISELEKLNKSAISKIIIPFAGEKYYFGDVKMEVLYPFSSLLGETGHNANDSSIVVQIEYEGKKILLAGDISEEIEKILIKKYGSRLQSYIFKANHHGSKSSNNLGFLQVVLPEIVVIQAGKENRFNHPHLEVLINFYKVNVREIFRNDIDKTVKFTW